MFQNCDVKGVAADLHCCYNLWPSFKMQCNQKVPRYNIFIFKAKHESTALRLFLKLRIRQEFEKAKTDKFPYISFFVASGPAQILKS